MVIFWPLLQICNLQICKFDGPGPRFGEYLKSLAIFEGLFSI